jgi:hypothetical protein
MLHNEELYNLYSSPDIVRMIRSRSMTWVWHVTQVGNMGTIYRILFVNLTEATEWET